MITALPVTLIAGDGIGPEIVDATLAALEALQVDFAWDRQAAGLAGVAAAGDPLPEATLASIRRTRLRSRDRWRRPREAAIDRRTCGCARSSSCTPTCALHAP